MILCYHGKSWQLLLVCLRASRHVSVSNLLRKYFIFDRLNVLRTFSLIEHDISAIFRIG
ncbi:hypothetical protein XFF6166_340006 [Xanthomonas citri pv. fuscans]|nr:hypothetical protein XFF6166_340006 [Xanthomonas citri pv. fuscans]SON95758.1 hypothetical protein XFF6990_250006 [Xanthomonas citri pv. fuscans]SOO02451.1 hypothetical protein XFF6960_620005 [Xanthomonas citri pv. fuscans]SOO06079.1 hypothetical protein XFF7767_620005 [Xanthomonas citri pv. fuscans]SOO17020.1 hypothetical protein XFF6992_110006 [Xanthomonas citri pv. fuscans]